MEVADPLRAVGLPKSQRQAGTGMRGAPVLVRGMGADRDCLPGAFVCLPVKLSALGAGSCAVRNSWPCW
jgi:hypothetical protein